MPALPFANALRGLFGKTETKSLPPPDSFTLSDASAAAWLFGALPTYAGVAVNPVSAMSVPAVSCAVELISQLVGTLPAELFTRGADDARTSDPTDLNYRLVHDEANDWTSASALRTQLTADAMLYDAGGFAFVNRVDGRVVELLRLMPGSVNVRYDPATGEPSYTVDGQSYGYSDILHIQAFGGGSTTMVNGIAPINRARNAIALALVLEEHASRLFGNGARVSGVLSYPNAVGDKALANIIAMWTATHGGSANSGKPAVIADGGKWEATALTSVDAQFLETRRHQTEEIARAFRVPPTMLFDLTRGTWANTEEMQRQFLTYTMRPWLDAWTWAYARVLLTPEERKTQYVAFDTNDLLSADFAARMVGYSQAIAARILNPNEARKAENLPPYAGGEKFENPNTIAANSNAPLPKEAVA